ncbi:MAG: glycosyltransferase [Acidimicrobiales bacterium]
MPAFDRDSGSQDIDNTIRWLLADGWSVTFLSREEEGVAEERHAERLRQMGVATFAGFDWAPKLLRSARFDLAIVAFWEVAEEVVPLLREFSPDTRVVINSMDIHFLRTARQSFGSDGVVGHDFGSAAARELNVYHAADAVLAVSDKERALLADFIGEDRVHTVPLAEQIDRSPVPCAERRGMYFVGNFRHVPNREAVTYLANEVLPMMDRALLEEHPLTVVGNYLDQITLDIDPSAPGLRMVGWVPSIRPYVERSRVAVVPLLHGAGVKRKVLQSMMAFTPVVTTPVGAEGLDLESGRHALIADDPADMAAALHPGAGRRRSLAGDGGRGADHVDARHGVREVGAHFTEVVETVMRRPRRRSTVAAYEVDPAHVDAAAIVHRVQATAAPGAPVLVAPSVRRRWWSSIPSGLALPGGVRRWMGRVRPARRSGGGHPPRSPTGPRGPLLRAAPAGLRLDAPLPELFDHLEARGSACTATTSSRSTTSSDPTRRWLSAPRPRRRCSSPARSRPGAAARLRISSPRWRRVIGCRCGRSGVPSTIPT